MPIKKATTKEKKIEQLEVALGIAMKTLDQIASTPRNRGAKRSAAATAAFLRTQLKGERP